MPLIRKPSKPSAPPATPVAIDVEKGLASASEDERWTAARAAAQSADCADVLLATLNTERSARVREALFTSLASIGSPQSIRAIVDFIRSDDAGLRAGALDALKARVEAIRSHLPALLSDADSDVRILSCELARSLPNEEATGLLSELLSREDQPNVCAAAIEVLAEAGGSEALAALNACEARFANTPFLSFAIQIARSRIQAQSAAPNG